MTTAASRWGRRRIGLALGTLGLALVLSFRSLWIVDAPPRPEALPPVLADVPEEPPSPLRVAPTEAAAAPSPLAPPSPHAPQPRAPAAAAPTAMPYRFLGMSGSGADASIVLFGRGRVVTLQGAEVLDDEYAVEAVFEDYLVIRHRPTGAGQFLPLARRQASAVPQHDAEASPRD